MYNIKKSIILFIISHHLLYYVKKKTIAYMTKSCHTLSCYGCAGHSLFVMMMLVDDREEYPQKKLTTL